MAGAREAGYWARESTLYWRPHPRLRFMARVLRKLPQRRLLDLGCSGAILRRLLPASFVYFGCDIADEARRCLPDGHFLQCDFNESADLRFFADKQIEVIHIGGLLEYLCRPDRLLDEARKLVAAGAPLVLSIINFESDYYAQPQSHHPKWIYRPGLNALLRILSDTGWRVGRVWPFTEKGRVKQLWLHARTKCLGLHHSSVRCSARQFILLAHAV